MNKPLISVVIPSYNSAQTVGQAIQSALDQTYLPVELVVVDDGSTDGTKQQLAPWMDRIRYIYQPNGGLSNARNRGINEARGDLIAFLDADDQWLPEKLDKQWKCLQETPDSGLVHTDLYHVYSPFGRWEYQYRDRRRFSGYCYNEFFWGNAIVPSTVIVTRRCLDEIGLFDEQIRGASTQDMDLWVRIARHYPLAYVDKPLMLYLHHTNNASLNKCMMLEDEFYVLEKMLHDDPSVKRTLGKKFVRHRMSNLGFYAGYANVDVGDLQRARHYFGRALTYEPLKIRTLVFWGSTFAAPDTRQKIRSLKQRIANMARKRKFSQS